MMMKYESPIIEIQYTEEDVITTSGGLQEGSDGGHIDDF